MHQSPAHHSDGKGFWALEVQQCCTGAKISGLWRCNNVVQEEQARIYEDTVHKGANSHYVHITVTDCVTHIKLINTTWEYQPVKNMGIRESCSITKC